MKKITLFTLLLTIFLLPSLQAQKNVKLLKGKKYEEPIDKNGKHTYTYYLEESQYFFGIVTQMGIEKVRKGLGKRNAKNKDYCRYEGRSIRSCFKYLCWEI